jgi:signal transduction histidine kinase
MRWSAPVGTVATVGVRDAAATALERMRQLPPWRVDAVLAVCFVVAGLATTGGAGAGYEPRDGIAIALVLLATVPYVARRYAPLPVFIVSVVATAALFARHNHGGALPMVVAIGAFTVAAYRPVREVLVGAAVLFAAFVVMLIAGSPEFGNAEFVLSIAVFAATMLAGWTWQSRRLRFEALEREQDAVALQAAADERLRIAQELHDVVAHSLGVIAVQAGVGMHVIDSDRDEARRAFEHISSTSRSSLADIRRALGMLRAGGNQPVYTPAPALADLPRLVDEVTGAGLRVDLSVGSDTTDVPSGVELAAYRIVQEALTNVLRHAHASRALVTLDTGVDGLHIVVTDDGVGTGGGARPGGHGLVGMRERVAVYGGSLDAGPAAGGGFRVDATLPYDRARADREGSST